tara:strand:- start:15 stop:428 length:414 start_codon:yes stop_codon:yes gene_type:complete
MSGYQDLLKKAMDTVPKAAQSTGVRFEIPKVKGHIQGSKTIITNFQAIAQTFGRDLQHFQKYLLRALATPGVIDGPRLVLGRKMNSNLINDKVIEYANTFVICKECKKPDTKIEKQGRILQLKCTACGAKHPIRSKI